jgi:hypothetical protein
VSGPILDPRANGTVTMTDARLRVRDMPIVITDMKARLLLDETSIAWRSLGAAGRRHHQRDRRGRAAGPAPPRPEPEHHRTRRRCAIPSAGGPAAAVERARRARTPTSRSPAGRAASCWPAPWTDRALYDSDIFLEEAFLPPQVPPEARRCRACGAVVISITLNLQSPLVVRNNLAELQADGGLQLRGDLAEPAPFGHKSRGRQGVPQGREFTITSGSFVCRALDPEIHVVATTVSEPARRRRGGDGGASGACEPRLSLTSVPPYSERSWPASSSPGGRT